MCHRSPPQDLHEAVTQARQTVLKKERELALAQEVSGRLANRQAPPEGGGDGRRELDAVGGGASATADRLGDSSALGSVFLKANKLWEESQHGFRKVTCTISDCNEA